MPQVTILQRVKLTSYPTPDQPRIVIAVTYQSGLLPPRTVYIPEAEDTPDKEKEVIAADVKKALAAKPEIISI